ncbi:hypothetical protein T492DRAFT_1074200 [Pavlovales sp. CCMP2436]|nr:hypothetical protein T492DRAFT_1074200 [Pavlovales sp. CCMP2436]
MCHTCTHDACASTDQFAGYGWLRRLVLGFDSSRLPGLEFGEQPVEVERVEHALHRGCDPRTVGRGDQWDQPL